ncbi:IS5 family transposase [Paraburkholderia sediminicola]|uniref:IS5 family transposase n=1 Tax=Paraburkholderia rhynchosiae TaxID=487049 RepID=A0ACC7NN65_9BURK
MKQQTLAMAADQGAGFETHRKRTRRDEFLDTMNAITPWAELCAVGEPHYPKRGNGRPPIGLERMLRIHFIQHWFNLADFACEEALYDSASLRRFAGIDLGCEAVPDATTLLKFRRLLEMHKLGEKLFAEVGRTLQASGMKLKSGSIVDATIIGAPGSTKNQQKARDPEMHQTRKGKQWHFGAKLHIGVDSQSGLVHSAVLTAANVHDKHPLPQLLHGQDRRVYGDSAYASQKALIRSKAPDAQDFTNQRTRRAGGEVDEVQRGKNRNKSKIRARVEHVFAVVKRLWGFTKVRSRGLEKNACRAFTALALANVYLSRRRLMASVRP